MKPNWGVVLLVLLSAVLAIIPVAVGMSPAAHRRHDWVQYLVLYMPAVVACFACYQFDRKVERPDKIQALALCAIFTLLSNYLHLWLVDQGQYTGSPNLPWQIKLQESVIKLDPTVLPHSYRFLPNAFVRLLERITGDFTVARDSYRHLFGFLLFYSLYRFARLFLRHPASLFSMALWAMVLPVSFRYYAGQLTDPMSHLSFVLAFIFIETEQFVYLVLTLIIGCLAKETVLAMAGYYALFRWREYAYLPKLLVLGAAGMATYIGVRLWVLHSAPTYSQISGVEFEHVVTNWKDPHWHGVLLYTVGIFVPFALMGWRRLPWTLRSLALYLFPVLFLSSLFFSWLPEGRNFMPLVAVLTVITAYQLFPEQRAAVREVGS